jgi:hypothetical protein
MTETSYTTSSPTNAKREFFSIPELAERWRCSEGTVYNRLRAVGATVLDFAPRGKRGKKVVAVHTVLQMERQKTVPLR